MPSGSSDPAWNAFWRIDPRPDGSRAPDGPLVDTIEDKFEARRRAGRPSPSSPAATSQSASAPTSPPSPCDGVEPSHVVLATRAGDRNRLVAAFRKIAQIQLGVTDQ